jgi:hypothetical protein
LPLQQISLRRILTPLALPRPTLTTATDLIVNGNAETAVNLAEILALHEDAVTEAGKNFVYC